MRYAVGKLKQGNNAVEMKGLEKVIKSKENEGESHLGLPFLKFTRKVYFCLLTYTGRNFLFIL